MSFGCHARPCSARLCAGSCRGAGRSPAFNNFLDWRSCNPWREADAVASGFGQDSGFQCPGDAGMMAKFRR